MSQHGSAHHRDLCAKLHLRAESQEIDRIIEAFSARFYECNPTTVFGSQGVVHTVTGAMLMLNTDLHIAELSKHMSRADFVRNAMRAIQESAPGFGESTPDSGDDSASARLSTTRRVPAPRSASAPVASTPPPSTNSDRSVSTATTRPSTGSVHSKAWESEAETALKVRRVWSGSDIRTSSTKSVRTRFSYLQTTSAIAKASYPSEANTAAQVCAALPAGATTTVSTH